MGFIRNKFLKGFNKVIQIFDKKQLSGGDPFHSQAFGDFAASGREFSFTTAKQQTNAYTQIAWVAIAVDRLARDAGSQEFFFIDNKNGNILEGNEVPDEISAPFVNGFAGLPFVGGLLSTFISHRALTGNAFFLKVSKTAFGKLNNQVEEFFPILPEDVFPKLNNAMTKIEFYEVSFGNNVRVKIPVERIIHFRQNTVFSPFWGVGNITKIRLTARGEASAESFQNEFLENRASPSLIIKTEDEYTPEDWDRYVKMIRQQYETRRNAGKILLLNGKNVDAKTIQLTQKDMQFLETKKFNRETILAVFGVPPVVAGIPEGANKAIAEVMRLQYLDNTINQIITEIEETLNSQFVHLIDDSIDFKLKRHATGDVINLKTMVDMGAIAPNRASELLGEEADWNDIGRSSFYLPSNLIPISEGSGSTTSRTNSIDGQKCANHPEELRFLTNPKNVEQIANYFEKRLNVERRFQIKFLRVSLKRRNSLEDRFAFILRKFFEQQEKRVIKKFKELFGERSIKQVLNEQSVDLIFDLGLEDGFFLDDAKKLHTSGIQGAVFDINQITDSQITASLSNPFVKTAIKRLGTRIVSSTDKFGNKRGINIKTQDALQKLILDGLNEGISIPEMTQRIQRKFQQFQGFRARMIARTESRAAWDAGAIVGYQELGAKTVDVVGCISTSIDSPYGTQDELDSDCGRVGIPIIQAGSLEFHPNHIGVVVPSEQV